MRRIIILICVIALTACLRPVSTPPVPTPANTKPAAAPSKTRTPARIALRTPTATSAPTLTATAKTSPTPVISAINFARPLYFLVGDVSGERRALYRLAPGSAAAEQVSLEGEEIASFDVWAGDERLAFGTQQGKLFVQLPGEKPRLLLDTAAKSPSPARINDMRWSPDGQRLAFSVRLQDHDIFQIPEPADPSGIWVIDFDGKHPVLLIRNNDYLAPDKEHGGYDVPALRVYDDPIWSPDGKALMVHDWHWEGSERVWFDPIRPVKDDSSLIGNPNGGPWSNAAWTVDGKGVLLTGLDYSSSSTILWVSRDGQKMNILVDVEGKDLYIENVFALQDGLFFVVHDNSTEGMDRFLYYASTLHDPIQWTQFTPDRICLPQSNSSVLQSTTGPRDNQLTLLCGRSLHIASYAEHSVEHFDLTPLLDYWDGAIIALGWGKE